MQHSVWSLPVELFIRAIPQEAGWARGRSELAIYIVANVSLTKYLYKACEEFKEPRLGGNARRYIKDRTDYDRRS